MILNCPRVLKCGYKHGFNLVRLASGATCSANKIAVVLSGCGVFDGTEIHEASAVLTHLTRNNAVPHCFAPRMKQYHVINHEAAIEDSTHKRDVLQESARIARGNIMSLDKLIETQACFDGVIFPGGFGAAKNLSNFSTEGVNCEVLPDVAQILKGFHENKKAIGLCCIAPILAARVLCGVKITLGLDAGEKWPYRGAIQQAKEMGALVEERNWDEVCYDKENLIFSTPAYMYEGQFHEIDDGIGKMIKYMLNVIRLSDKPCPN